MDRKVTHLNIGCGPYLAPDPWFNVDVIDNDEVKPDQVVSEDVSYTATFPYVERIYLGHVLEHIDWDDCAALVDDLFDALKPNGGELLVVGPDVFKAIELYRRGKLGWGTLVGCLEHQHEMHMVGGEYWRGATHKWNCEEKRVMELLIEAGFTQVIAHDAGDQALNEWPVVARSHFQCFVRAIA